jgi:hypothetical protein
MKPFSTYFSKRDKFVDDYESVSSENLRDKLRRCIFLTDVCMLTFIEFVQALKIGAEDLVRKQKQAEEMKRQNIALLARLQQLDAQIPEEDSKLEQLYQAAGEMMKRGFKISSAGL